MNAEDPAMQGWQAAIEQDEARLSTSAKARRRVRELAQVRDSVGEAFRAVEKLSADLAAAVAELATTRTELTLARHDAEHCAAERDSAYIQVRRLTGELLDVCGPSWIVARDGGRSCDRCEHEIRRGEAYTYLGVDKLRHIHCPGPEATDG